MFTFTGKLVHVRDKEHGYILGKLVDIGIDALTVEIIGDGSKKVKIVSYILFGCVIHLVLLLSRSNFRSMMCSPQKKT